MRIGGWLLWALVSGCSQFGVGEELPAPAPDPALDAGTKPPVTGTPVAAFSFVAIPPQPRLMPDVPLTVALKLTRPKAQTENIVVTVDGVPAGVTVSPLVIPGDKASGDLAITASGAVKQGPFDVTVKAVTGTLETTTKLSLFVRGKPGTLDTTFGVEGRRLSVLPSFINTVGPAAILVNAKDEIFVVGGCAPLLTCVARLRADGSIDTTYGGVSRPIGIGNPATAALDHAGRVVVGSSFAPPTLGRFNDSGEVDTAFGLVPIAPADTNLQPVRSVTGIVFNTSDDIYASFEGGALIGVTMLTSAGKVAPTFAKAGTLTVGWTTGQSTMSGFGLRTNSAGQQVIAVAGGWVAPDNSSGFSMTQVDAATAFPDQTQKPEGAGAPSILIARQGTFAVLPGTTAKDSRTVAMGRGFDGNMYLAIFLADGKPDKNFGTGGVKSLGATDVDGLLRQADGKLVMNGPRTSDRIERFNPDGERDVSFGTGGTFSATPYPGSLSSGIALQSDGRIVQGSTDGTAIYVTRVWN